MFIDFYGDCSYQRLLLFTDIIDLFLSLFDSKAEQHIRSILLVRDSFYIVFIRCCTFVGGEGMAIRGEEEAISEKK